LRLDGILVAGLFEIAEAGGVIHGFHLEFVVEAFLGGAEAGVADIRSDDFEFPGWRDQGLRRRHFEGQRIAQVVVGERVADEDGDRIGFLAGGGTRAPNAEIPVAAFLLVAKDFLENGFLEEIELRAIAEKAGFIDGEILEEERKFGATFAAGKQAVIRVERIKLATFKRRCRRSFRKWERRSSRTCRIPGRPASGAA